MPRLAEVLESEPDSLKIEGRNRSEYYVASVVHAYRAAMDAYARDPEHFDPSSFMADLEKLETRGYTTAFFDGPVKPDAHNYESARSVSDYHAAGVVTNVADDKIIFELRNEICAGDEITFLIPGSAEKLSIKLPEIINAKNGVAQPKMSAGQTNSIIIPREWVGADADKLVPLVVAYKHK
jgi:putative protease